MRKVLLLLAIGFFGLTSCSEETIEYVEVPGETIVEYVEVIEYVTEAGAILDANLIGKFVRRGQSYVFNYDGTFKLYENDVIVNFGDWNVDLALDQSKRIVLTDSNGESSFTYIFNNRNRLRLDGLLWRRRLI